MFENFTGRLQYRKRYELLQLQKFLSEFVFLRERYNTASGMSCCNYRKLTLVKNKVSHCYNTASGMSCCNLEVLELTELDGAESYNTASGMSCCNLPM